MIIKICEHCGQEFVAKESKQRFCCHRCFLDHLQKTLEIKDEGVFSDVWSKVNRIAYWLAIRGLESHPKAKKAVDVDDIIQEMMLHIVVSIRNGYDYKMGRSYLIPILKRSLYKSLHLSYPKNEVYIEEQLTPDSIDFTVATCNPENTYITKEFIQKAYKIAPLYIESNVTGKSELEYAKEMNKHWFTIRQTKLEQEQKLKAWIG